MLYYLVARTTCCMVGIEQCRIFAVRRSQRAAFEKEFAGRILLVGSTALSWPVQYCVYKRAPALLSFTGRNTDRLISRRGIKKETDFLGQSRIGV
jgi:hypothetical protein